MLFFNDIVFNSICQLTLIQFIITWVVSFLLKNVAIIDFLWGTTYAVHCAVSFYINFFNMNNNYNSATNTLTSGKSDDTIVVTTAQEINANQADIKSVPYVSNLIIALFALGVVSFHGLRLSTYLGRRVLLTGEDKRYADFRKKIGEKHFWWISLFMIFIGQWFVSMIICAPFRTIITAIFNIKTRSDVNYSLFFFGLVFAHFGTWYEAIADAQVSNFLIRNNCFYKKKEESMVDESTKQDDITHIVNDKSNNSNTDSKPSPSKLYTKGLWRLSRHPNYFGENVFHWGIYIVSISLGNYFAFYSPLLMSLVHKYVSGVPLTEKYMKNNKYYGDEYKNKYMKEVKNAIIPEFSKIFSFNKQDVKVE